MAEVLVLSVTLKFGDVRRLVALVHALPRSRVSAVEARLKNMMRLGFPRTDGVGSGERADYRMDQVLQFMLAFELLRFRMPPAAAAHLVTQGWAGSSAAFAAAARRLLGETGGDGPLWLVVDALALHEPGKTVIPDDHLSTIDVVAAAEIGPGTAGAGARSLLAIDPEALLAAVVGMLPGLKRRIAPDDLLRAVAALG